MKQRGFTLFEMIVAIVMMAIGVTVILNIAGAINGQSTVSYGINGMTEMRCIDGYKFIVGQEGNVRQVMDEFGKGLKCQ